MMAQPEAACRQREDAAADWDILDFRRPSCLGAPGWAKIDL